MSSLDTLTKNNPISEVSHLDTKDENIDEKYQDFKESINNGTYKKEMLSLSEKHL